MYITIFECIESNDTPKSYLKKKVRYCMQIIVSFLVLHLVSTKENAQAASSAVAIHHPDAHMPA